MDRQEQNIKGVTAGSDIPVYRIYVGQGQEPDEPEEPA